MRTLPTPLLTIALAFASLATGACTLIELPEATPGGSGGASGVSECQTAEDCLPTGTECILRSCNDGMCEYGPADDFVPIGNQAVGDCRQVVCNGAGGEKKVNVEDPFDDGNDCTADSCADGVVVNQSVEGMSCPTGVCSASGVCVECLDASQCIGNTNGATECQGGKCVPASCTNTVQDGDETDVDCGGPCVPCDIGEGCASGADCLSLVCNDATLTCSPPSCEDGVTNGDESDEDCGGDDCLGCVAGQSCNKKSDCESVVCISGTCEAPTCSDGVLNGSETDVDCGGADCGPCPTGATCLEAADCASKVCANTCKAPSCSDGIKNGNENNVDCGGSCPPCKDVVPGELPQQP